MKTKNNITVHWIRCNEVYDIYEVTGVENIDEDVEPIYHKELRSNGSTEESVLEEYLSE